MVAEFSLQDYQAALSAAAFYRVTRAGYLRLQGADRLAFLQRQTTNDVTRLAPGHTILTVLTNPAARILDVLLLLPEPDDVMGMLTLPGLAGETARFLKSRIFFKDQVSLSDASHDAGANRPGGTLCQGSACPPGYPAASRGGNAGIRGDRRRGHTRPGYAGLCAAGNPAARARRAGRSGRGCPHPPGRDAAHASQLPDPARGKLPAGG